MSHIEYKISIPTDNEGYILLQCPFCGEFFKLKPEDTEDDRILDIHCPRCGLTDKSFITEEVLNLALTMARNLSKDYIFQEMNKLERNFKKGPVSLKSGKKPMLEFENPVQARIDALTITKFKCCNRSAKIKLLLKFSGCYCPFCGVKEFELK